MYSGFVLFCEKSSFGQCVSRRLYKCSDTYKGKPEIIKRGSVLFMYDPQSKTLVGPFTAASEGATKIETGAWRSEVDLSSFSGNIKLEWEDLHIIKNANERFPFLNSPEKCALSSLNVQTLLDSLKAAPIYQG